MKKKTYIPKKRTKKVNIPNYDDLVFADAIEEEHEEDIDESFDNDDEVDLVEEALIEKEIIEKVKDDEDNKFTYDLPKNKKKKPADKEKFYVDPKKFDDEIVKYYDTDKMSNELAEMVSKISHKLSYAPNFINYTYREEMVGDGVIRMMKALMSKKYNREKGTNPFSYFTRIAFNAFRNRIKKEKHMAKTHEKYQEELLMMSSNYNTIMKNNNLRVTQDR